MRKFILLPFFLLLFSCNASQKKATIVKTVDKAINAKKFPGFINYSWDKDKGEIWLTVKELDKEFLYINSLPAGLGSNDIGLDRGQLGQTRIVKFIRSGNKLLMIQPNYQYRAISDNEEERKSVEEAFAQSVIWGFKIEGKVDNGFKVNATSFLLRDAHDVAGRLKESKQGSYKLDNSRSAVYLERCKNFPENTELEAMLTFTGKPSGAYVRQVVPSPKSITCRQHHSFVALPDDDFVPRKMDPRCGFFGISYQDYATPIDQPLVKRFINKHRLKKKNPDAATSEAVEPIVYYLDRGAPEPVRSALLDGARWWNQAFEAAGYKDAFRVEILPEGVDPLDVRYNVIQWVHRATRGWSYGSSINDPRTGEIIKGHVSLGSLRVRQDFLIAQGLLSPYEKGKPVSKEMQEMALARLRQLSAHEIGHTLGLAHNFAASVNDRASVMDYPHPLIQFDENGNPDFSKAYDDKIGEWDKRTILYGYSDFPSNTNVVDALNNILAENENMGFHYISDRDARPQGGLHPFAHLWDNGKSAIDEFERMAKVRAKAMERFGENAIPELAAMSDLEEVFAPLYLSLRYQSEGVAKLIGGMDYNYAVRGGDNVLEYVQADVQKKAIETLLQSLDAQFLAVPDHILKLIPPKPMGYNRGRESFKSRRGLGFDPIAAAESMAAPVIKLLLNPERCARMIEQNALDSTLPGLDYMVEKLLDATWKKANGSDYAGQIANTVEVLILNEMMHLAVHESASPNVKAMLWYSLNELESFLKNKTNSGTTTQKAHATFGLGQISQFKANPDSWKPIKVKEMPAGSPIGCGHLH